MSFRKKSYFPAILTAALACCLAPFASASAMTIGGASPPAPLVEVCGQGPALLEPASMILTCADGGELAEHLHWTSWTASKATATGTVTWRVCGSLCAASTRYASASADYTLSRPMLFGGRILFTRLDVNVTGSTPQGFHRTQAFDEAPTSLPVPAFNGSRARQARAVPSGTLGYAEIEGYWLYAGGPNGSSGGYTQAQIAAAITGAESSFEPGIIQPGVDYCGAGSDRAGWGLWQITCGNSVPQYGTDFQVLDPWNNAEEAVYKCVQDANAGYNCFDPWSTWQDGAYQSYLQNTAPDMNISDPGEYVQVNSTPPGTPSSPGPNPGSTYGPPMPNSRPAAPSVSMTSPVSHLVGGNVIVSASASDSTSGATLSTQFYVDGQAYGSAQSGASPSITWDSSAVNGLHTLSATTTASNSAGSASATTAVITVQVVNGFQAAFNANSTNKLYLYGNGTGAADGGTPVGVAPGTSPAIARLASGGFEIAFTAANTDDLYLYGQGNGAVDGAAGTLRVAPGTSPAIAALPGGGFQVVFSSYTGNVLWRFGHGSGSSTGSTPVGLAAGTSPAIAVLSGGGYEVAFNANSTDDLYFYGEGNGAIDGAAGTLRVAPGTNPAIAALPGGGFQTVFSSYTGNVLWRFGHGSGSYTGSTPVGLAAGTSPAIAVLSGGGYEVAFNANSTNKLYLYGAVDGPTLVGVAPGTNPAIMALPSNGFQIVFSAYGSDTLWRYGHGSGSYTGSTPVGLASGTSPAIS